MTMSFLQWGEGWLMYFIQEKNCQATGALVIVAQIKLPVPQFSPISNYLHVSRRPSSEKNSLTWTSREQRNDFKLSGIWVKWWHYQKKYSKGFEIYFEVQNKPSEFEIMRFYCIWICSENDCLLALWETISMTVIMPWFILIVFVQYCVPGERVLHRQYMPHRKYSECRQPKWSVCT